MTPCPDENTFAAFMAGLLTEEDRTAVEAHLDSCAVCGEMLAGAVRAEPPPPSAVPTKIGRYEVLRTLGEGGMGVVLEAFDPALDRLVALKLLLPGMDPTAGARLVDEAKAIARLSHQHVVTVLDAGVFEDRYYVAMERVSGITLRRWLSARPRTSEEVLTVFRQVGEGLVAVHAQGLTHRDLKPENVLVDARADGVHATLIDFGLAQHVTFKRRAREVAGTLPYMAPEQLRGEVVDARTDQFTFCVTLHEALYGHRPVVPGTVRSAAEETVVPPGRAVSDTVPDWLSRVVARGLELDPARRWPSMKVLLVELLSDDSRTHDAQRRLNALFQVAMYPLHIGVNILMFMALTSTRAAETTQDIGPLGDFLAGVLATWLVGAFLTGWAPLGLLWVPINVYGLFRGRRWAYRSTVIYSIFAIPSVVGTPFAIYALSTLWRRAFPKKRG